MGKYPKARVVPFSSVVGSSVTLHDPETERVIGQLGIMNVGGDTPADWKARSIAVAEDTAKRINCHDDLVTALKASRAALELQGFVGAGAHGSGDPEINIIDAALAKAEAGTVRLGEIGE
jgi:hypothetical protein